MTVKITKPEINLREKLSELDKETGIKGEELLRADTSAEAREALQLDQQLFTDFESTGIDDNATSTAVTIDSSGNLLVGNTVTDPATSNVNGVAITAGGQVIASLNGAAATFNRRVSDGDIAIFKKGGTTVGSISVTASATAYNTSSDQRLKENITDANDAGSKVDAIQVRQFDWKADGSHQDYGMIAQELVTVAPEAVSQPEDSEDMMGVDYSKLVPMLIKEVQSLRARVAQLESN